MAAAVGASALLAASRTAYQVLTLAGALYLVVFGARLLWASRRASPPDGDTVGVGQVGAHHRSLATTFAAGAGTNLLNPKIGVFSVASVRSSSPTTRPTCS